MHVAGINQSPLYQESKPPQESSHAEQPSVGATVEFVLEFSPQNGHPLNQVAPLYATIAGKLFSLVTPTGLTKPNIEFVTPLRYKFKMMAPSTTNTEAIKLLFQPQGEQMKQFRALCDTQMCHFIEYNISESVPVDSKPVADIPPAERQRFERFVAVLQEYVTKGMPRVYTEYLKKCCRERGVLTGTQSLTPLLTRAVADGFLTLEGDQGLKEAILKADKIEDFIKKLLERMQMLSHAEA